MVTVVACIIGFIVGVIITSIIFHRLVIGNFRIDNSDPSEQPYVFLEMDAKSGGLRRVMNLKYVVMRVVVKDYISHE